jgi:inosine-uridine nucleoside N-ribohydrolase
MKRRLLIAGACVSALVLLCFLLAMPAGGLLVRMGVQPLCIQGSWPNVRIVSCPQPTAAAPPIVPGEARSLDPGARPFIIDTDMAPDDWMAILYLLQHPGVDVRAITVVGTGETHCAPGVQNARNLATLAGRPGIPVACGREMPLEGSHSFPAEWRVRADTMAGLALPTNSGSGEGETAIQLLTDTAQASPRTVTIVALGPLTNLAEALQADPSVAGRIARVYIMGGAFGTPGNVTPSDAGIDNEAAEWNIYVDPHAAELVIRSGVPLTFVPLDATNQAPITEAFYERLGNDRSAPPAEFVHRLLTIELDQIQAGRWWFWDPLAAAIASDESLGVYVEQPVAVVEDEGPQSGETRVANDGHPVQVTTAVDRARFEAVLLEILNGRGPSE